MVALDMEGMQIRLHVPPCSNAGARQACKQEWCAKLQHFWDKAGMQTGVPTSPHGSFGIEQACKQTSLWGNVPELGGHSTQAD